MKGWSDKDLPIIVDQVSHWTLAEASYVLGVPLGRLRLKVRSSEITPCGRRPHGDRGRAPRVYAGAALVRIAEEIQ